MQGGEGKVGHHPVQGEGVDCRFRRGGIFWLIFTVDLFPNVVKAINMILGEQEQVTEGES